MNLVPTELNHKLADAVRYSVDADRFYISGKAGFWRLLGMGLLACGIGAACGIGFYGYSYVTQNSTSQNILSASFSKALSEAQLRATADGTIDIQPRELSLAKEQTISLAPNSSILLDPNSKVIADGEIIVQAPSVSALPSAAVRTAAPKIPEISNFTVFKSVEFDGGQVMTGWKFLTSAQRAPTSQYCYYTLKTEESHFQPVIFIGTDGKLDLPKQLPKSFDVAAAFSKCVWFKT